MNSPSAPKTSAIASFRARLLMGMMLVVSAVTALALYFVQHKVAADAERDLNREFQGELASLHRLHELRQAALAGRCIELAKNPRIHAALEDNALDLLYPSAKDALRDVMGAKDAQAPVPAAPGLHAIFYRFLGGNGAVISPPNTHDVGELSAEEESQLALKAVPDKQQLGYLLRKTDGGRAAIAEVIAMPIISTETGQVIAAIVLGFKPVELGGKRARSGIKSGIWLNGRLHLPSLAESAQAALGAEVTRAVASPNDAESSFAAHVDGAPHLVFYKRLNPDSLFPPACEVCIFPLADSLARQQQLRWQIVGAGALLLLGGLAASHFVSARLSVPVEKLAVVSEENRAHWERAEAALKLTHEELQRSARFSADASHQLKTPVTVLRAGLEELLAREDFMSEVREEISELIHQTYRLASIIEDLLLLSRIDAGRLQLEFAPVNLTQLIEASLDDLDALPDALELAVETDFPAGLHMAGEKRYTALIVQNLLENARKYNRPGGRIRVTAREDGSSVLLTIGNTGRPIPAAARAHIFERFHRGSIGENVPGYGLGLNLAHELARIHNGDLRLARSDETWTEFEVRFRPAGQMPIGAVAVA